ncbi:MAG TPA: hypothetical protein IAC70_06555 [Candidatus Faecicola pullistercoris]|nr:hypothetical protein [Candidatus Faecicola pullistercoris]
MEKAKILKRFSRYGKAESAITVFAVACCLVSFGLFFTGGVGNPGGDSLPSFKIAFDVRADGLHFNAAAFFAHLLPLICGAVMLLPLKERKWFIIPAGVLLVSAVIQFSMLDVFLLKYSEDVAAMYLKGGTAIRGETQVAGVFSILAATLAAVKCIYPWIAGYAKKQEVGK